MSEQGTRTLELSTPGVQTTAGAQVKLGASRQQEDTEKKVVDWCRENPVTVCVCTCGATGEVRGTKSDVP